MLTFFLAPLSGGRSFSFFLLCPPSVLPNSSMDGGNFFFSGGSSVSFQRPTSPLSNLRFPEPSVWSWSQTRQVFVWFNPQPNPSNIISLNNYIIFKYNYNITSPSENLLSTSCQTQPHVMDLPDNRGQRRGQSAAVIIYANRLLPLLKYKF